MSRYSYSNIKALAKSLGVRVTELIALAPQNDPFYAGTPGDWQAARWFAEVWRQAGYSNGAHLRRVHYWCLSREPVLPDGSPYENTDKCWKFLGQASKMARYLGLVDIPDIIDQKNPPPEIYAQYDYSEPNFEIDRPLLHHPYIYITGLNASDARPYHLEVWCEKSTMNDVLKPVCRRYGANLATFEGEVSITSCYDLVSKRIEASGGKPTRIFYISDFDPAGKSMPVAMARKVEYMLSMSDKGYDVKLKPIVLTEDQVQTYKLPRTPIKDSERRAAGFEDVYGAGAVELDALEALYPGVLRSIVEQAIKPYYNPEIDNAVDLAEKNLRHAIREKIDEITRRYLDEIEALQPMLDEIAAIEVDVSQYAVKPLPGQVTEDDSEWMFDSQRDYVEQITHYKAHKGKDSALESVA